MDILLLRHPIVVGVAALAFFSWILDPLMDFVVRLILISSGRYADSLFRNAALGNENWINVLLLLITFTAFTWALLSMSLIIGSKGKANKSDLFRRLIGSHSTIRILAIVVLFFVWLGLSSPVIRVYSSVHLNASFEQRLTVLAPHINEQKKEELRAGWASMESWDDYRELNNLFDVSGDLALELPEPFARS